jgi:hypothetical protein
VAGAAAMRAALARGREMEFDSVRCGWLAASHSDGRGGTHTTGFRYWLTVCCFVFGIDPLPSARLMQQYEVQVFYEEAIENMFSWVYMTRPYGRVVSAASCSQYTSEARGGYRRKRRTRLGLPVESSRIPDLVKGCSRMHTQPPKRKRFGVSPRQLAAGWKAVGASRMVRAATATALVGMMRGCEVALMDGETFEAEQHLVPADVEVVGPRQPTRDELRARLRMRKRKDLRVLRGKHDVVILAAALDAAAFDVVEELESWLAERRALGIPETHMLFCHEDGSALTVRQLRDAVKGMMAAIGLDPARFGAHSLRIGGATAALAAGVSPSLIRIMGRWSSDVYEIYCRMSEESALGVGRAIASASVMTFEQGFHSEELELLPEELEHIGAIVGADEA